MSGHVTAESLSLYLDAALPSAKRQRLTGHLDACPECRQRLDGLRRVVTGLGRLPSAAPPEDLAARVRREIDLRGRRSRWRRLLDGGLPAPLLSSPPIHILALILALGAIVYLFALGLEVHRERPTRIVPLGAGSFVVEQGTQPVAPAMGVQAEESLYLLGGRFHRTDGVWVEEGLAARAPDSRIYLDAAAAAAAAMEAAPAQDVAELAALGAPLRMRVGDEVVEITFETVAP